MENLNEAAALAVRAEYIVYDIKRALNNIISEIPMSNRESLILRLVVKNEEQGKKTTSTELSNILCVSKPAVSQFLASLEKDGYITRTVSENDRRRTYISSTKKAQTQIKQFEKYAGNTILTIKNKMGAEKFETLLSLLEETTEIFNDITQNNKLHLSSEE